MPLHAGREFLSIPGPTVIPDVVLAAMQRPAVDIYSGPLVALTDCLLADLSKIFRTAGRSYIYIANGHGAWEAALTNVLSRGDKVLVLESGRFAIGWGEAARMLGGEVEILPGDFRRAVQPAGGRGAAEGRRKGEIKAMLVAQIDTASGVVNDIKAIGAGGARGRPRRAADGRCGRLARLHAVRDGRLGRRRRDGGLAEGADDAARPRLRRRRAARQGGAQDGRHALALLGLDLARGRAALPEICRHAARASAVRAARRARPDLRRRARQRVHAATACSPRRRAARSAPGRRGSRSASTCPSRKSVPTRSPPW